MFYAITVGVRSRTSQHSMTRGLLADSDSELTFDLLELMLKYRK